jgi:acyl-CoA dehydrogenase
VSTPAAAPAATTTTLFNPRSYDAAEFDEPTRRVLLATIEYFESRGKTRLKTEDRDRTWYADFLDFVRSERVFATLLTPARDAAGDPGKRWDTARICAFNEIIGFYGIPHWYTWQVSILGLGPIWQSDNPAPRRRAAELLDQGAIFAFGLSEREHGADIYSTDMILTPKDGGSFSASGGKYYIGNGNLAKPPSTPRSTPSTSASSTSASARSASASTPSTRPSPTQTPASSSASR